MWFILLFIVDAYDSAITSKEKNYSKIRKNGHLLSKSVKDQVCPEQEENLAENEFKKSHQPHWGKHF